MSRHRQEDAVRGTKNAPTTHSVPHQRPNRVVRIDDEISISYCMCPNCYRMLQAVLRHPYFTPKKKQITLRASPWLRYRSALGSDVLRLTTICRRKPVRISVSTVSASEEPWPALVRRRRRCGKRKDCCQWGWFISRVGRLPEHRFPYGRPVCCSPPVK
jgi:hypothetical protein